MKLVLIVSILSITVTKSLARTTEASVITGGGQKVTSTNETEADIAELTAPKAAATVTVGPAAATVTVGPAAVTVTVGPVTDSVATAGPVTNETVTPGSVAGGPVTNSDVTNGSVADNNSLTAGPITDNNMTTGIVTFGLITDDNNVTMALVTINNGSLADGNFTNGPLTDSFVTSGPVTDGNVTAGSDWNLATGQVTSGNVTAGSDWNLATGQVTGGNVTAGSDWNLATGQVTGGNVTAGSDWNLATGQVTGGNVTAGSDWNLTTGQVTDGNITAGQVADVNATTGPAPDLNTTSGWQTIDPTTENITDQASSSVISTDLCDVRAGEQCQRKLLNLISNVIGFSRLSSSAAVLLPSICQDYNATLRPCLTSSLKGCDAERRLNSAMIISAMDFICLAPEGLTAVTDALPCYSNRSTRRDMTFCQQLTARSLLFSQGVCGATVTYVKCLANVYKIHCGETASQAIQIILYKGTEPLRQMLLCPAILTTPAPTTPSTNLTAAGPVTPASPVAGSTNLAGSGSARSLRCYQCDSGDVMRDRARFDKNCVDGELGREYLSPIHLPCPAPCYTRVRGTRTGGVARGCAAGLEAEFPGGVLPPVGCHRLPGSDWFCLCDTPRCNRQDVERYITFELP